MEKKSSVIYTVSKIPADIYLPGGARFEVFHGVVKCSTNLNSDPVDMLLDCLNDVVLGGPKIHTAPVGLRVIDPDHINIMITGHQHPMFTFLQDRQITDDVKKA